MTLIRCDPPPVGSMTGAAQRDFFEQVTTPSDRQILRAHPGVWFQLTNKRQRFPELWADAHVKALRKAARKHAVKVTTRASWAAGLSTVYIQHDPLLALRASEGRLR